MRRAQKRSRASREEVYNQIARVAGLTAQATEKTTVEYLRSELVKLHRMIWIVLAVALFGIHWWAGTAYCVLWILREVPAFISRRRRGRSDTASEDRGPAPTPE